MNTTTKKFDLEDRFVQFAGNIIKMSRVLKNSRETDNLANQLIRSSNSAALNFGEVQGAQSINDFIHKTRIVLKELKETRVNLKILNFAGLNDQSRNLEILDECEQLIAIIASIIKKKENQKLTRDT